MVFNVAQKSCSSKRTPSAEKKKVTMTKIVIAIFLFLFSVNVAHTLITPEEAKNLALRQSDILSAKISHNSHINEQSLLDFITTYKNFARVGHVRTVKHKFSKIVDSLRFIKTRYDKFQAFANAYRDLKNHLKVEDLYDDAMEVYSVANNEKKGHVDVFNVLAHNQDLETKCVTNASSADLIKQLYESVAYAQVEALTVQLYTHKLLEQQNGESHKTEMDKLVQQFTDKMNVTLGNFNKAIATASEQAKKCNNQTSH